MVPLCRHIKPDNTRCKSPAVHGQLYCYHHKVVKLATHRPPRKKYDFTYIIPFKFAEDRAAIQINLHLINNALMEGRIDTRTANAYNHNQRIALSNLRLGPLAEEHDKDNAIRRVILTPEGDEIAPPREVLEKDESPIHYKDCPCQRCAEQFRGAAPEQHHADCKCGLCEDTSEPRSALSDQSDAKLSTQECHPERTGAPSERSLLDGVGGEGPASSQAATAARTAPAHALRSADTLDPIQKEPNYHHYVDGDEIAKHEAQHVARVRAALEAGLEPPEHQVWHPSTHETKWAREDREWREGIDQRRKEAIDEWNRLYPDRPMEFKPYLTWGEEHDLKLAEMKRLKEQEEARARGEDVPVASRPFPASVTDNPQLDDRKLEANS